MPTRCSLILGVLTTGVGDMRENLGLAVRITACLAYERGRYDAEQGERSSTLYLCAWCQDHPEATHDEKREEHVRAVFEHLGQASREAH